MAATLVIGIGNPWRGDDAAGLLAAHALQARALPEVTVVEAGGIDSALIDLWQDAGCVILIDAVVSGAAPGTVHCIDLSQETLPASHTFCSTHALDLSALLDLARVLDRLPPQLWVYGIEAGDFTHGRPVSEAVILGLARCVEKIVAATQTGYETTNNGLRARRFPA